MVRIGRAILAFSFALLWLFLPVHCQIEAVSASALLECAGESDCSGAPEKECERDFCASLESGQYTVGKGWKFQAATWAICASELPSLSAAPRLLIRDLIPLAMDPRMGESWQFAQRAVPPARAPSCTAA